ncbi:MAG: glutamine-hydrolyzing GMP synthase [Chloroflexota bacterium]|nr:glutamine-hydrolyzing GMP synthase [Chloroflexota bacterium]
MHLEEQTADHASDKRAGPAQTRLTAEIAAGQTELPPAPPAQESVVVVDFGSQYSQLITRRVRELNVYSHLIPADADWSSVEQLHPRAVILSGGPSSVYDPGAPQLPTWVAQSGLPVLAICYGLQLLAHELGGKVEPASVREYGPATVRIEHGSPLFDGLPTELPVWMSHGDSVTSLPHGFELLGSSPAARYAAVRRGDTYGLQFHPEVAHTPSGKQLLRNFLYKVAGLAPTWTPAHFVEDAVEQIRGQVGEGRVLCALSGGVDSSVAATLIHRAIGDRLTCIFVDNGLLRQGEAEKVVRVFGERQHLPLRHVDASDRFLKALEGVTDPEEKRKRIGETFVRVFEEESTSLGEIEFLAQGTLYPDVIESTSADTRAAQRIKTHHNVGGLPEDIRFKLIEPLRLLFKDEVRQVGSELGLPDALVYRQPFPGPGLAVRILGEVTRERLDVLRAADAIVRSEIALAGLERVIWQSFAVLTPLRTVGVMGDGRTYGHVVAVRAVTSDDAMTAAWARLPYDLLDRLSTRLVNEVPEVTRVVYDVTSKPPGTIEWE